MKLIALSLLLAAAVVYVIARANEDEGAAWGYIRAFAEAAMVGALADWFAVTALFRHPLGLPIPHTAIIPNRKDADRQVAGRVRRDELHVPGGARRTPRRRAGGATARRVAARARQRRTSRRGASPTSSAARSRSSTIPRCRTAIERVVENRIRATQVAPLFGKAIELAIEGGHHQRLLDAIFTGLQGFLDDNRVAFRERLEEESPWWVPSAIDDRIFAKIYDGVTRFLSDVGGDPDNEVRRSIEARIVAFADRLRDDPEMLAKGEQLKEELLAHPDMRAWIESLWRDAKQGLIEATSQPDSELHQRITASLQRLGERLRADPALQAKVDQWVARAVGYVVDNYRSEVSKLIESTIERWDGESTSRKIELQVGRDLQFIRINGTVVGGLAGLLIHAIGELLHQVAARRDAQPTTVGSET